MTEVSDTGLIPEPLFESLAATSTIAGYTQGAAFDIRNICDLAFLAGEADPGNLTTFERALSSRDPVARYWATQGFLILGSKASTGADSLVPLLEDKHPVIRATAAEALFAMGKKEIASNALLADVNSPMDESSLLNHLNILRRLDLLAQVPKAWIEEKSGKDGYLHRFMELDENP
jgi:HEAT repeat protein